MSTHNPDDEFEQIMQRLDLDAETLQPATPNPQPACEPEAPEPQPALAPVADDPRVAPTGPSNEQQHGDERITTGAFTAVATVTVAVAALAFALSFTMMLTAAQHYGWPHSLAPLFPSLIDVGAIGGTFMGAISTNRVYRRIGHQVLAITLAASVLFNLVGHSIRSSPAGSGLPAGWGWTGTVAAILVPGLLAYFVHAFSAALRTFTEQRRTDTAAADAVAIEAPPPAPASEPEPGPAAASVSMLVEPTPMPQPQPEPDPEPESVVKPAPEPDPEPQPEPEATARKRPASHTSTSKLDKAAALRIGVEQHARTPSKLREALHTAGYTVTQAQSTVENWCAAIRQQLDTPGDA